MLFFLIFFVIPPREGEQAALCTLRNKKLLFLLGIKTVTSKTGKKKYH